MIVMSYVWAPLRNAGYVTRLRDALKPGGLLIFEHYRASHGAQPGEIRKDFGEFKILHYEESVARSDWLFQSRQPLVRMVATR